MINTRKTKKANEKEIDELQFRGDLSRSNRHSKKSREVQI
jgi:hypothetical protein